MSELLPGSTHRFTVKEVAENSDSYQSSKTSKGTMHCHLLMLEDPKDAFEQPVVAQICNEYTFYKDCQPGDEVEVVIKSFTKNKYNLQSLKNLSTSTEPARSTVVAPIHRPTNNPPMAGTAAAIALQCAAQFCGRIADEAVPGEITRPDVLTTAESFYKFLISKN